MRYLTKTLDFDSRGDSVVTLGKFDGLHRGHMILIAVSLQSAERKDWKRLCLRLTCRRSRKCSMSSRISC